MEEAQHAKLDTLIVDALAEGRSEAEIDKAIDDFFEIGGVPRRRPEDAGRRSTSTRSRKSSAASSRTAPTIEAQQHQAARWTYIGSGMVHERFKATLAEHLAEGRGSHRRSGADLRLTTHQPKGESECWTPSRTRPSTASTSPPSAKSSKRSRRTLRKAMVGFDVTTRWNGQTRSEIDRRRLHTGGERITRSHTIVADEPCELLGGDSAPNPQELLMAAFNACITVGYVAGASLQGHQARICSRSRPAASSTCAASSASATPSRPGTRTSTMRCHQG